MYLSLSQGIPPFVINDVKTSKNLFFDKKLPTIRINMKN